MLLIHPVVQGLMLCVAVYALYLGSERVRVLHFHQKMTFPWKRHVIVGSLAILIWFSGMCSAMAVVYVYWKGFMITGLHGTIAWVMLPLFLFGFGSGFFMNRFKKKRTVLPLLHALNNTALIILAGIQIKTGYGVYQMYVAG